MLLLPGLRQDLMSAAWPPGIANVRAARIRVTDGVPGAARQNGRMPTLWTVGHGTLAAPAFAALISEAGIQVVVDVRRYPGSRRNPQFGSDQMAAWLADAGVDYDWAPSLGGRRKVSAGSPNTGLRNPQFRAYADHMATAEFRDGVDHLLATAAERTVAVMCAESVWWRCHRRLLADHLVLVEGWDVEHVMHDGRRVDHTATPAARAVGRAVIYGGEVPLPFGGRDD
jgi:uncharacterized protein (DUF488 family)